MANILILKCLKDDDDRSMAAMGESLKTAKENKEHTVTLLDFKDVLPLKNRSFGFENNEKFDEVYFTGHSRYLEPTTNFGTRAWVVRPIGEPDGGRLHGCGVDAVHPLRHQQGVVLILSTGLPSHDSGVIPDPYATPA